MKLLPQIIPKMDLSYINYNLSMYHIINPFHKGLEPTKFQEKEKKFQLNPTSASTKNRPLAKKLNFIVAGNILSAIFLLLKVKSLQQQKLRNFNDFFYSNGC